MPAPPLSARQILDRPVAFSTVSCNSNIARLDWVESDLAQCGGPATRVYHDDGTKAALYANVGRMDAGVIVLSGHSYGTKAGQFQDAGSSCVVCGPGDIALARQPDEYPELAEFNGGWQFMQQLVAELAR